MEKSIKGLSQRTLSFFRLEPDTVLYTLAQKAKETHFKTLNNICPCKDFLSQRSIEKNFKTLFLWLQ